MPDDPVRRHHISSIVEHFLAPPVTAVAGKTGVSEPLTGCMFFVGAAAENRLAALVAALLARLVQSLVTVPVGGRVPPRVVMEEWHRLPWSAAGLRTGDHKTHLRACFRPPRPAERGEGSASWPVVPEAAPRAGQVVVVDLGCPQPMGTELRASNAPAELFWCVTAQESDLLRAAHRLGWLAAVLRPERIVALLFPQAGALACGAQPHAAASQARGLGRSALERWRRPLSRAVAPMTLELRAPEWPGVSAAGDGRADLCKVLRQCLAAMSGRPAISGEIS